MVLFFRIIWYNSKSKAFKTQRQEKTVDQKKWRFLKNYIGWGVTVVAVSAIVLTVYFGFYKFDALKAAIGDLLHILAPVIYGLIIAYLLAPIYDWLFKRTTVFFARVWKNPGKRTGTLAKTVAMMLTFAIMFVIIFGLLAMLIPRVIASITGIVETFPSTINNLSASVQGIISKIAGDNTEVETNAMRLYVQAVTYVEHWMQTSVEPQLKEMFGYFTGIVLNMVLFLKNFVIGVVVAIYILSSKEKFASKAKKFLYAIFGARNGNFIMENIRFADNAFGGFLIGKVVDSAIIGLITGVVLAIMKMPYALILAVVIGITNIIPFFGPFIGAVPCTILIFLVSPFKALQFVIYIVIIQQFDGNILGPKILGNTTGVSSFGVLFSIVFFGGLFGFIGMIIGVPLFAVITHMFKDLLNLALDKKHLPKDSREYENMQKIDERTHEVVRIQRPEPVVVNDKRPPEPPESSGQTKSE